MKITTFFFFLVLVSSPAFAQEWTLKKEEDGIKVYTRFMPGSEIEDVLCKFRVKARLSAFTGMVKDVAGYCDWAYNCAESKLIEQINDTAQIYYSHTSLPWPVSDRDLVMRSSLKQDPKTFVIKTRSFSVSGYVPEKDGIVRMSRAATGWTVTPLKGGVLEIEYLVSVDPGGSIPVWLVNSTISMGPLNTMQAVKKLLEGGKYKDAEFWFVKELE